ncbi:MAG TPA: PQQ-binding-like beta-propeller repeat protein, partial [Planctomycetota bacterium]|nr:PQQ-binding-like beta-propeller repeat protein [Planctomycetota bacterium]
TYRGDYGRSGYFPGALGAAKSGQSFEALLYVVANYQYLFALDTRTGNEIWKVKMACECSSPFVANGILYVGSGIDSPGDDTHVYALNALTGGPIWKARTGGQVAESLVMSDGRLYVGSKDEYFYSFDAASGELFWKVPLPGAAFSPHSVHGRRVYINAAILDAKTGNTLLANTTGGLTSPGSAVCEGDVVFRGFGDNYINAIDSVSGKQIWKLDMKDSVYGSLAFDTGRLYAFMGAGTACGIDPKNGGQVYVPAGIDRADVNPRPLSRSIPSNGLIGCFSADGKRILATAWEPYQELFQGVIVCIHSDFRLGGLEPGETRTAKGKIYLVENDPAKLLQRYEAELPGARGSSGS